MKALVVYESMFGNTEKVAHAIADGLRPYGDVHVAEVGAADPSIEGFDLLVVGGPTHALGMSRPSTRADAMKQTTHSLVSGSRGVREWLALLPVVSAVVVATFDTKVYKARRLPGCARAAARVLRKRGQKPIGRESYYVDDMQGPLLHGELDRAVAWGTTLAQRVAESSRS